MEQLEQTEINLLPLRSENPYKHVAVLVELIRKSDVSNGSQLTYGEVRSKMEASKAEIENEIQVISKFLERYGTYEHPTVLNQRNSIFKAACRLIQIGFYLNTVFSDEESKMVYDLVLYVLQGTEPEAFEAVSCLHQRRAETISLQRLRHYHSIPRSAQEEVESNNEERDDKQQGEREPLTSSVPTTRPPPHNDINGIYVKPDETLEEGAYQKDLSPWGGVGIITCYYCGGSGHKKSSCTKNHTYWKNIIRVYCNDCNLILQRTKRAKLRGNCWKCKRSFKTYYIKHDNIVKEREEYLSNPNQTQIRSSEYYDNWWSEYETKRMADKKKGEKLQFKIAPRFAPPPLELAKKRSFRRGSNIKTKRLSKPVPGSKRSTPFHHSPELPENKTTSSSPQPELHSCRETGIADVVVECNVSLSSSPPNTTELCPIGSPRGLSQNPSQDIGILEYNMGIGPPPSTQTILNETAQEEGDDPGNEELLVGTERDPPPSYPTTAVASLAINESSAHIQKETECEDGELLSADVGESHKQNSHQNYQPIELTFECSKQDGETGMPYSSSDNEECNGHASKTIPVKEVHFILNDATRKCDQIVSYNAVFSTEQTNKSKNPSNSLRTLQFPHAKNEVEETVAVADNNQQNFGREMPDEDALIRADDIHFDRYNDDQAKNNITPPPSPSTKLSITGVNLHTETSSPDPVLPQKRKGGRPRKQKTGLPGRPRKHQNSQCARNRSENLPAPPTNPGPPIAHSSAKDSVDQKPDNITVQCSSPGQTIPPPTRKRGRPRKIQSEQVGGKVVSVSSETQQKEESDLSAISEHTYDLQRSNTHPLVRLGNPGPFSAPKRKRGRPNKHQAAQTDINTNEIIPDLPQSQHTVSEHKFTQSDIDIEIVLIHEASMLQRHDKRYTLARRLPPNSIKKVPALPTSKNEKPVAKVWCCNRWLSKEVYRDHELSFIHLRKINYSRRRTLKRLVAKLRVIKAERYCQVCNIVFARAHMYSKHMKRAQKREGGCNPNRKKKENLLELAEKLQFRFEKEMRYNYKARKLVRRTKDYLKKKI